MQQSKLSPFVLAIIALGCGSSQPSAYVDVQAVLASEKPGAFSLTPASKSADLPLPSREWKMSPSGSINLSKAEDRERIQQAQSEIDRSLLEARRITQERLFRTYLKDVTRFRTEEEPKIAVTEAELNNKAETTKSMLLQELAEKRYPYLKELTLKTQYPLPKPGDIDPLRADQPAVRRLLEQIRRDLQTLVTLDEEYKIQTREIDTKNKAEITRQRLELEVEIQKRIDQLQQQAKQEAEAAYPAGTTLYESPLSNTISKAVPNLPARSVRTNPGSILPDRSQWKVLPSSVPTIAEIEAQIEVYLTKQGMRYSQTPVPGRDFTKGFIEWRRKHRLGH